MESIPHISQHGRPRALAGARRSPITSNVRGRVEPIFRCSICKGPIALWAVRQEFTCHHCHWALSSNCGVAFARAMAVAAVAELVLAAGLCLWLGEPRAVNVWLAGSCVIGYSAGWLAVRKFLVVTPLRPPVPSIHETVAHEASNP